MASAVFPGRASASFLDSINGDTISGAVLDTGSTGWEFSVDRESETLPSSDLASGTTISLVVILIMGLSE
jgi:hypothetical protein